MMTVYFIRHAESVGNVNNHIIGGRSSHLPLTDRGQVQAHALGNRLKEEKQKFDLIYASDAVRAQHTAQIAASHLNFASDDIQINPQLAEVSQGDWEGKIRAEIFTPARMQEVAADPLHFCAPNGESQQDARLRMLDFLNELVEKYSDSAPHIAAFSHGYAIRSLVGQLLEASAWMTRQIITHNTSLTVLRWKDPIWMIDRINDYAHLRDTPFIDHY